MDLATKTEEANDRSGMTEFYNTDILHVDNTDTQV